MTWWQKLIIIVVISIFVVGCVLGGLFIGFMYAPKPAVAKQRVIVKVVVKEEAATIETSVVEETSIKETREVVIPEGVIPEPYESEGGLPTSGSTWSFDVFPKEIEVVTGGPGMINNVKLPGGTNPDRGFVIIMLPSTDTIRYEITELAPGSNWHGAYKYGRVPTEVDWQVLRDNRVTAMMDPEEGNGTLGKGCQIVDVVVVQGDKVIYQKTFERQ